MTEQEASSYREVMIRPPEASEAIFREVHRVGVIDVLNSIPIEAEVLVQDALNLMHQRAYHLQKASMLGSQTVEYTTWAWLCPA